MVPLPVSVSTGVFAITAMHTGGPLASPFGYSGAFENGVRILVGYASNSVSATIPVKVLIIGM